MCVSILFLQSLKDAVPLLRGEMTSDADSEHVGQSHFSVGHSTRKLGRLCGVLAERNKPCVTQTQRRDYAALLVGEWCCFFNLVLFLSLFKLCQCKGLGGPISQTLLLILIMEITQG